MCHGYVMRAVIGGGLEEGVVPEIPRDHLDGISSLLGDGRGVERLHDERDVHLGGILPHERLVSIRRFAALLIVQMHGDRPITQLSKDREQSDRVPPPAHADDNLSRCRREKLMPIHAPGCEPGGALDDRVPGHGGGHRPKRLSSSSIGILMRVGRPCGHAYGISQSKSWSMRPRISFVVRRTPGRMALRRAMLLARFSFPLICSPCRYALY